MLQGSKPEWGWPTVGDENVIINSSVLDVCSKVHGWAGPQQADAQADAQTLQGWCLQPTMQQLGL